MRYSNYKVDGSKTDKFHTSSMALVIKHLIHGPLQNSGYLEVSHALAMKLKSNCNSLLEEIMKPPNRRNQPPATLTGEQMVTLQALGCRVQVPLYSTHCRHKQLNQSPPKPMGTPRMQLHCRPHLLLILSAMVHWCRNSLSSSR